MEVRRGKMTEIQIRNRAMNKIISGWSKHCDTQLSELVRG